MNNQNQLEEIPDPNHRSLKTLTRAIAISQGRFSLILVRCNYGSLRSQILQRLHQESNRDIPELILAPSTQTLYTAILEQFNSQPLDGLMVLGLESVENLHDLLIATNRVRDRFLSFTFPIVLWVTDGVLKKLRRIAPDFFSWMTPPIEFTMPNNELMALVRENADLAFTDDPKFTLDSAELKTIQDDLQNQEEELLPEMKAIISLILGLIKFRENQIDEAIEQYQASLAFWQETNQFERSGVVWLNIAWAYYLKGKDYQTETRNRIRESIAQFEQGNSSDLLANHSRKLGELLRQLGEWESLERISQKVIKIHQRQGETRLVARDYSFLAEVALRKEDWQDAKQQAQQGLDLLKKIPDPHPKVLGLCYFILAKSQQHLGQIKDAIANLEHAHTLGENLHQYDPHLYVEILAELRTLNFEQAEYLSAFNLKLEQIKIENQYGLRAFIGARRLPPAKQMINPVSGERKTVPIEDAIQEFGREKDIEELVERVKRRDRKLTIIYGPSGVGKSSIIEAALIPVLKQTYFEGRYILPILVRVYKDWVGTLAQALTDALEKHHHQSVGAALEDNVSQPQTNEQNPSSVKSIIKQLRQNEHRNLYTVLIFDQFEEFFFDNPSPSSRREFYRLLYQSWEIPYLKVILSLREDSLHYLLEFRRNAYLTNLEINYDHILYYLGNFVPKNAKKLIKELTTRSQSALPDDLVNELVNDLAAELGEVRPIELQVVGAQLETEKINTLQNYRKLVNNPKDKLVDLFLEAVVRDCGKDNKRVAELVLYWLTNENNTRPLKTQAELAKDLGVDTQKLELVLKILSGSGLLLLVPGIPDNRYQLVHDYFVSFVRHKYQPQFWALEEEREKLKQFQKRVVVGSVVATFVMTGLAITAGIFGWRMNEMRLEAAKQARIANSHLDQLISLSNQLFSNQQLDALIVIIKGGNRFKDPRSIKPDTKNLVINALVNGVYNIRESNRLEGHSDRVISVTFSPDGETIASASYDKTVKLWKKDGTLIKTLTEHSDGVNSVSFSPDGETIASASEDGTVKLWKKDGTLITTLTEYSDGVNSVSFSPDGETIASASEDGIVKLWKKDGTLIPTRIEHNLAVYSVSFSPDSQTIASASKDGTVKLWKKDGTLIKTLTGHRDRVNSVSFSPDGQTIASASWDKTVKLWKKDGTLLTTLTGHSGIVTSVSFSRDGETIVSASTDTTVKLWKKDGHLISTLTGHNTTVNGVSFSPDGKTIASASGDNTVKLWKKDGTPITTLTGHSDGIFSVNFSPDGETIASASGDGTVKLWKKDGTFIKTLTGHSDWVTSVNFSPDGETIASASRDNTVKLWKKDGTFIKTLTGHSSWVYSVSFSPDGETIASASYDNTVKLWKKDGTFITNLTKDKSLVYTVSFSPDSQTIATAGYDKTVKLWKKDGTLLTTLIGHSNWVNSVSFSPDGQTIASASWDSTVKLWKKDGTPITTLTNHSNGVNSVSFSPDGETIASASWDHTVKLWKKDGTPITTLAGHSNGVTSVSFSPDGQTIASASGDGTVKLWDYNLDALLVRSCSWLHDYLHNRSVNLSEEDRKICDGINAQ